MDPAVMVPRARRLVVVRLVLGWALISTVGACRDTPADITPLSGNWSSVALEEVADDCNPEVTIAPPLSDSAFLIDHDRGDLFQIELGADDIECDIDGVEFLCDEWEITTFDIPNVMATLTWTQTLQGTLDSSSLAEGLETVNVTCAGPDCMSIDGVPCRQQWRYRMSAIN